MYLNEEEIKELQEREEIISAIEKLRTDSNPNEDFKSGYRLGINNSMAYIKNLQNKIDKAIKYANENVLYDGSYNTVQGLIKILKEKVNE